MSSHSGGARRQRGGSLRGQGAPTGGTGGTRIDGSAQARLNAWFGRTLSQDEVRRMVGAPPDAHVSVGLRKDRTTDILGSPEGMVKFEMSGPPVPVERIDINGNPVTVHVPLYSADEGRGADRYLLRHPDGTLEMYNATFRVVRDYQHTGVGAPIFAREVKTLSAMGVKDIFADMAGWRGSSDQGYRVWPLLGYNTRPGDIHNLYRPLMSDKGLSGETRAYIKAIGEDRLTVLDLYARADSRAWWGEHGSSAHGEFDLQPDSRSMQVLRAYLDRKGISWYDL